MTSPTPSHRMAIRRRAMPSLQARAQCASCPPLADCPVCPKGQMCQLQVPPTCQQCPTNACVADPAYGDNNNKSAAMGGAIGGIMGALALAAVLIWILRNRHQRAKEAARRARADAKERTASNEKFRIGSKRSSADEGKDAGTHTAWGKKSTGQAGLARQKSSAGGDAAPYADNNDEEEDEEDVEWTELREDGLTAFRKKPGVEGDEDVPQDLEALRRRSIGAATHLSRITEGAEDDEEEEKVRDALRRSAHRNTIIEEDEQDRSLKGREPSAKSFGHDAQTSGAQKTFNSANPFSDASEVHSPQTSSTGSYEITLARESVSSSVAERASSMASADSQLHPSRWSEMSLSAPSRVHRPTGAPLVDVSGKPRSAFSTSASSHGKPISPLPHSQNMMPLRPLRDSGLNLRLEDGTEPGKIGKDLRAKRLPFESSSSPTGQAQSVASEFDDQVGDLPTQLAGSSVYSKQGKTGQASRASVMTASSAGTLDYVMSAPRIVASEGPKRVHVQQGGKAQLVRSLSAVRRDKEAAAAARQSMGTISVASGDDPFADGSHAGESHNVGDNSLDPQSESSFGNDAHGRDLRFAGSANKLTANQYGNVYRASNVSAASLPFTTDRPMQEPLDRSPTDAHPRDSISVLSRPDVQSRRSSSASSLAGNTREAAQYAAKTHALASQRQSGASIGGLSVFDDIPFQIGDGETSTSAKAEELPADAQTKIQQSKRRLEQEQQQALTSGSPAMSVGSIEGRSQSITQPLRTGTQPAFDEIRLRHELDNYPFDLSSTKSGK